MTDCHGFVLNCCCLIHFLFCFNITRVLFLSAPHRVKPDMCETNTIGQNIDWPFFLPYLYKRFMSSNGLCLKIVCSSSQSNFLLSNDVLAHYIEKTGIGLHLDVLLDKGTR